MAEKIKIGCGKGGAADLGCACYLADPTTLGREGNCLRFPPQIVAITQQTPQGVALVPGAMFPRVGREWFCYEWREAKPTETVN